MRVITLTIIFFSSALLINFTSAYLFYKGLPLEPESSYINGSGEMTIRYSNHFSKNDKTEIYLKLKNLELNENEEYHAWMIDEDSNFYASLGVIDVSKNGRVNKVLKKENFNLFSFDKFLITQEPKSDFDLHPAKHIFSVKMPFKRENIQMKAELNGRNEIPKVRTMAKGIAEIDLDTENNLIKYKINYKKLSSNETAAHIHGFSHEKSNAQVLFSLPLGNNKSGEVHYPEEIEGKILSGQTYINIHSEKYPDGEIRGQILIN